VLRKTLSIITIFLSAFLLFQVQPIIAKILLPGFGGVASVWITCMLFFQMVLLGGYVYAHWIISILRPIRQAWVHVSLLVLSLFILPMTPAHHLQDAGNLILFCIFSISSLSR